ncbi:MAG: N-succinylarginine dihydrolase, partial [Sphingomonadales bacterium]
GLQLFVYGRQAFDKDSSQKKFPRRQTLEASEAIARRHQLDPDQTHFVQQNPAAIDGGAFHNDVVSVSNKNVFFYHEEAFVDPASLQTELQKKAGDMDLHFIEVPKDQVSLQDVVGSYLFNSQLISIPGEEQMTLILPLEAKENPNTKNYLEGLIAGNQPIGRTAFLDVRQSMRNGGGPACLRLRVVLTEEEQSSLGANVIMNDGLYEELCTWVKAHYRDRLSADDLTDPALMEESFKALDELTGILKLGSVYDFQNE